MQFFNVLEKKCYRYRAAAAMTFSKTCRDRAAMDISGFYSIMPFDIIL
jgi:hypothetical protein